MSRKEILEKLSRNEISVDEADLALSTIQIEEIGSIANYDIFRERRTGIPEIILAETKSSSMVLEITEKVLGKKPVVLISRTKPEHLEVLKKLESDYIVEYGTNGHFCRISRKDYNLKTDQGKIGIITAGTSDLPIAEEAKAIAEMMGCEVYIINDVGVAGIHRLFEPLKQLLEKDVDVLIVAAGMEGALPTVVAGLVDIPVIGLPISTGYGLGGKGQTALMSMLQTCSLGLAVVNIDAGISAGSMAAKIAIRKNKHKS